MYLQVCYMCIYIHFKKNEDVIVRCILLYYILHKHMHHSCHLLQNYFMVPSLTLASERPAPRATLWGFATIFGTVQIVLMSSYPEGPAVTSNFAFSTSQLNSWNVLHTALLIIKNPEIHQPLEGKTKD